MFRRLSLTSKRARFASPSPFRNTAKSHSSRVQTESGTLNAGSPGALSRVRKIIKYSVLGGVAIGLAVYGNLELAHQYIEHRALRPDVDEELKEFQWDVSGELWQGHPSAGGTDPGLGHAGRNAVRSAWWSIHWGSGGTELPSGAEHLGLTPADTSTVYAIQFLLQALVVAQTRKNLHPLTGPELHYRIASLYEKLGKVFSDQAKAHFEQAWKGYSGQGLHAARIALKLGDINSRLHQNEEAHQWWRTAVQLCGGQLSIGQPPKDVPSSPWAQRILASTLVSVSAFYAQTGKWRDAERFQESSLAFLQSIPTPDSIIHSSPPQALHALFLLQRSSLISIHLAEVLNVQKKPIASSIQYLSLAAESSERVARALADLPLHQAPGIIPRGEDQISPAFSSSPILRRVARRLYHESKRTSAEAWNLLGVLYEQHEGRTSQTALQCYERAVQWASEENETANESTTESDWKTFSSNLQRSQTALVEKEAK